MSEVIKTGRVTQSSNTTGDLPDANPNVAKLTAVNEAVAKAGGITQPTLTAKQQEKKDKKDREYWNGMITRREVVQIIQDFAEDSNRKFQTLYIQNASLLKVLQDRGLVTAEELDEASKVVMEELFGALPDQPEVHNVAEAPVEEPK